VLVHFGLYMLVTYAILGWATAYYMRNFGLSLYQAGLTMRGILSCACIGSVTTGLLGDRWIRKRAFAGRLRIALVVPFLIIPGLLLWFVSGNFAWSIVGGIISYLSSAMIHTSAPLTIADITPHAFRGRMGAVYLGFVSLFGVVMGPLCVASITDFVFHDER